MTALGKRFKPQGGSEQEKVERAKAEETAKRIREEAQRLEQEAAEWSQKGEEEKKKATQEVAKEAQRKIGEELQQQAGLWITSTAKSG